MKTPRPTTNKAKKQSPRPSGTSAILSLGASIESVSDAFLTTSSMPAGIQPSPIRRKAAIKAIEETEGLSDVVLLKFSSG